VLITRVCAHRDARDGIPLPEKLVEAWRNGGNTDYMMAAIDEASTPPDGASLCLCVYHAVYDGFFPTR